MSDQYKSGWENIVHAVEMALQERRVPDASVTHDREEGAVGPVTLTITVPSRSASQRFEKQEIEDSGMAIDAPAALKVRLLVSQFVR